MKKQKNLALLAMLLLLQMSAQAAESLLVYPANGGMAQITQLDNVQCLKFANDTLLLTTTTGSEISYALAETGKITIEDVEDVPTNISTKNAVEISVYPNPSTEDITISGNILSWTLLDLNGKTLKQASTLNVPAGDLPTGVYLLKINTAQGSVTKKIIKK